MLAGANDYMPVQVDDQQFIDLQLRHRALRDVGRHEGRIVVLYVLANILLVGPILCIDLERLEIAVHRMAHAVHRDERTGLLEPREAWHHDPLLNQDRAGAQQTEYPRQEEHDFGPNIHARPVNRMTPGITCSRAYARA